MASMILKATLNLQGRIMRPRYSTNYCRKKKFLRLMDWPMSDSSCRICLKRLRSVWMSEEKMMTSSKQMRADFQRTDEITMSIGCWNCQVHFSNRPACIWNGRDPGVQWNTFYSGTLRPPECSSIPNCSQGYWRCWYNPVCGLINPATASCRSRKSWRNWVVDIRYRTEVNRLY